MERRRQLLVTLGEVVGVTLIRRRGKVTMSNLYRPVNQPPPPPHPNQKGSKSKPLQEHSTGLSKSYRLMVDNGLVRPSSAFGAFHLLPLGLRSLEKLLRLVDTFMEAADAQKLQMPLLTSQTLWETTGRLEECSSELMMVTDRHKKRFLLSPTHEEAVCDLLNHTPLSYRQLPLRLYQITDKFRDEKRPRFGLLRGRQFLMKDLYTFDTSEENAKLTYGEIVKVYGQLFDALGLKWVKASGSCGSIGGTMSDEFHLVSDLGEDNIIHCHSCGADFNGELLTTTTVTENQEVVASVSATAGGGSTHNHRHTSQTVSNETSCINCRSTELSASKSIEVAHAFLLGTRYTKPLQTCYTSEDSSPILMEMGCYGIGVSRLLAAIVEVSSKENEIRWPPLIAPYFLSILPPKAGSKEEKSGGASMFSQFYKIISQMFGSDIILDDRAELTVGKRFMDAKKLGIPYVAIFGKSLLSELAPGIELQDVNSGETQILSCNDLVKFLYDARSQVQNVVPLV